MEMFLKSNSYNSSDHYNSVSMVVVSEIEKEKAQQTANKSDQTQPNMAQVST